MKSRVRLFAGTPLTPARNLKIDSIEDFLPSPLYDDNGDFNYVKHGLDITIKVAMAEYSSDVLTSARNANYCAITNYRTTGSADTWQKTFYYFVTKVEPVAESACRLYLHMDVINTFNGDYSISPSSTIHRQHMDRFVKADYAWGEPVTASNLDLQPLGTWSVVNDYGKHWTATYTVSSLADAEVDFISARANAMIDGNPASTFSFSNGVFTATFDRIYPGIPPTMISVFFKYRVKETVSDRIRPIVSYTDEGIVPVLFKTKEDIIPQVAGQSWNLIYRNDDAVDETAYNEDNPVTAWLCGDRVAPVAIQTTTSVVKTYSDFASGYTLIRPLDNPIIELAITATDGNHRWVIKDIDPADETAKWFVAIYRSSTNLSVFLMSALRSGGVIEYYKYPYAQEISSVSTIEFVNSPEYVMAYVSATQPTNYYVASDTQIAVGGSEDKVVSAITDIDRKDAKLVKIIKLPFPPSLVTLSQEWEGCYDFGSAWEYDSGDHILKITTTDPTFDYLIDAEVDSPMTPLALFEDDLDPSATRYLDDPKLLNSAFHKAKFVYDSFAFSFDLELVDADRWIESGSETLPFRFVTSRTFNSKFGFIFTDYVLKYSLSDYDNVLMVSRNNEVPIFTSQYVNYLRTAYRYDLKNLDRTRTQSALGLTGAVGSAGFAVASLASQNYLGAVVGFAGAIASAVTAVQSAQKAEDAIAQKKLQLENESASISASDDIDMLMAYSNNQPKVVYYDVSPLMKTALNNLFHYCGYAVETSGIPDETSRVWFNFVQADIDILNPNNVPTYALDEIKTRYSAGLTVLHKHNGIYNINQDKENYEVSLL